MLVVQLLSHETQNWTRSSGHSDHYPPYQISIMRLLHAYLLFPAAEYWQNDGCALVCQRAFNPQVSTRASGTRNRYDAAPHSSGFSGDGAVMDGRDFDDWDEIGTQRCRNTEAKRRKPRPTVYIDDVRSAKQAYRNQFNPSICAALPVASGAHARQCVQFYFLQILEEPPSRVIFIF